jgi:hypothetical protein
MQLDYSNQQLSDLKDGSFPATRRPWSPCYILAPYFRNPTDEFWHPELFKFAFALVSPSEIFSFRKTKVLRKEDLVH